MQQFEGQELNIADFWSAVLAQDAQAIRAYFCPDAEIRWHCTNERFDLEEFIVANCEYPGSWAGTVERVERMGELWITVTRVYPKDRSASFHVTSFIKTRGGKIAILDEYWADDGEAPQWRQEKRLGVPIC